MGITISADNPRSIRAIEIAAEASTWRRWRTPGGEEAFGIPSQTHPGRYYLVTSTSCECPDFLRRGDAHPDGDAEERACKHILAVRLYCELVRAQESEAQPGRAARHLRLLR